MKITIEIPGDLYSRAKNLARERRISLDSLIEETLFRQLNQQAERTRISPVTFQGEGLAGEFANASWDKIRNAIY